MNFKIGIFIINTILTSLTLNAQDKIYKKNGSVIDAKVKGVTPTIVNYKRFDNPDGPDYTILKRDVDKIVYQNGMVDKFGSDNEAQSMEKSRGGHKTKHDLNKFGDNILTLIPAAYTVDAFNNTINDPGIGICYERMLDVNGHISFCLPVMINFVQNKDFNSDFFNNYGGSNYSVSGSYTSCFLMPGVKFYPADNGNKFRYSLGASFFALFGNEPYTVYDNSSITQASGNWHYTMYGLMISNSLNVSVSRHLYMEFDLNGGVPFSDNRSNNQNAFTDLLPLLQVTMKAGYRF